MATSLSVASVSLSRLTDITPVALQAVTTGTATSVPEIVESSSSIVEFSPLGQLASAASLFGNRLETLQTSLTDTSPTGVINTAQDLVNAFNAFQESLGALPVLFEALPATALVDQFSQALTDLTTTASTASDSALASVAPLGITLQTSSSPATAGPAATLTIDQNVLQAAVTANPAGAQALLAQATQAFVDQATGFETQVTGAVAALTINLNTTSGLNTNSPFQSIVAPTNLLQDLSSTTVLNNLQLANLDLASLDLNPGTTTLPANGTLPGSLTDILLPAGATDLLAPTGNLPAAGLSGITNLLAPNQVPSPNTATTTVPAPAVETPAVTIQLLPTGNTIPTTNQGAATPATDTAGEVLAANRRTSDATLALQKLVEDPTSRATTNVLDPAYAAAIASSHLIDFIAPMQGINLKALATDLPAPVRPITPARSIASYNQTVGGESPHTFRAAA